LLRCLVDVLSNLGERAFVPNILAKGFELFRRPGNSPWPKPQVCGGCYGDCNRGAQPARRPRRKISLWEVVSCLSNLSLNELAVAQAAQIVRDGA
jgi:hypothetical protein